MKGVKKKAQKGVDTVNRSGHKGFTAIKRLTREQTMMTTELIKAGWKQADPGISDFRRDMCSIVGSCRFDNKGRMVARFVLCVGGAVIEGPYVSFPLQAKPGDEAAALRALGKQIMPDGRTVAEWATSRPARKKSARV